MIEALNLIASGDLQAMRMWLLRHEPTQSNNHLPLVSCTFGTLAMLIAEQAIKEANGG